MTFEDEEPAFWLQKPVQVLVDTAVVLHRERRLAAERRGAEEVLAVRRAVGHMVLCGNGVEVGAGDRPWPLPPAATCYYGDIRDRDGLAEYFGTTAVADDRILDAQTFQGISEAAFDFVISAHVIEHLQDPIGAIWATMRVLRSGGVAVIAIPDMRHTFDRNRPPVTLEHLQADAQDGGLGTRMQAYLEHVHYVHPLLTGDPPFPPEEAERQAQRICDAAMDVHVHAWTGETFKDHLLAIAENRFDLQAHVPVGNENIYVLRKTEP